jgi:hypothetical protein
MHEVVLQALTHLTELQALRGTWASSQIQEDAARAYRGLSELSKEGDHRMMGSYFRVGFYGSGFNNLDGAEFVYKVAILLCVL